jgi:hypothetical protein
VYPQKQFIDAIESIGWHPYDKTSRIYLENLAPNFHGRERNVVLSEKTN